MTDVLAEGRKLLAAWRKAETNAQNVVRSEPRDVVAEQTPLVIASIARAAYSEWLVAHGEALLDCAEKGLAMNEEGAVDGGIVMFPRDLWEEFEAALAALNPGDARDHSKLSPRPEGETKE